MRMRGFVVGGLLGAAATMLLSRGNRAFNLGTLSSAGQALDRFVNTARSRLMNPDQRSYYGATNTNTNNNRNAANNMNNNTTAGGNTNNNTYGASTANAANTMTGNQTQSHTGSQTHSSQSTANTSTSGKSDLGAVQQIVNKDPQLSKQVNEILNENKDTTTTLR